jgi:hypothetical protein
MAFAHGRNAGALVAQYNATAWLNSLEVARTAQAAETTTFGSTAKTYISGNTDATISASGFWDGDAGQLDLVLTGIMDAGNLVPYTWCPQGITVSAPAQVMVGVNTEYGVSTPVGGVVAAKLSAQVSDGAYWGKVLNGTASITGTVTGTTQDAGASGVTTNGGRVNIHATLNSRSTSIDVKLQHSTDGSTWVDVSGGQQTVPAGVAVTGSAPYGQPTSYSLKVSGTINRYTRVLITPTAGTGSAIITVAFARY